MGTPAGWEAHQSPLSPAVPAQPVCSRPGPPPGGPPRCAPRWPTSALPTVTSCTAHKQVRVFFMNAPYDKIRCLDFPHSLWAMQTRAGLCLVMLQRLFPCDIGALRQLGASQVAPAVKRLSPKARRDTGSIPGSARSPGGGHGNPLQFS